MTPADVSDAVVAAAGQAVTDGELAVRVPDEVPLSCVDAGVYGTPLALRLAGERSAREVAGVIAERLARVPGVRRVEVTGAGFLTITVDRPGRLARSILDNRDAYGRADAIHRRGKAWPDRPRRFGNPGFEVRYAYARAAAVRRRAKDLGLEAGDPAGLEHGCELALLKELAELHGRTRQAVRNADASPLRRQLERIADAYHDVYEQCPALPVGDEEPKPTHQARLTLTEAVRVALANGLCTIGETPEEDI